MRIRPLVGVAAGAVATATAFAGAPATLAAAPHAPHVKVVPASSGHIAERGLASPPSTADCQAQLGINCYNPVQFQRAYDLQPLYAQGYTGKGRTIVIVDSFGSPTIRNDLHVFDQQYGLPDPELKIIQPAGQVPPFDFANPDPDQVGWAQETTLDVEWAHAIAPGAKILLVETPVAETEGITGFPEIVKAENYVIDHRLGDVITQSFGATEESFASPAQLRSQRSAFFNAAAHGVTVLASTGDGGVENVDVNNNPIKSPTVIWPASDPLVTAVGGTQLFLDAAGNRTAPDTTWNDGYGATGGGLSSVFGRPFYQNSVHKVVDGRRGIPDISLSAAVDGGVVVYYSFVKPTSPWHIFGGTSEASPLFSGVVAIAAQIAHHRLGLINPDLYALGHRPAKRSGIVDVTTGNNSFDGVTGYSAGPGYDLATGLGTVDANRFARALAARSEDGGRH